MTKNLTPEETLDNEWYAVRHSGEIPEVALYSAFYYLTEDDQGPRLGLTDEIRNRLVAAADSRFREIVLRDLRRACYNWSRYETFCRRQGLDPTGLRHQAAGALLVFLVEETVAIRHQGRPLSINCSVDELQQLVDRLGLASRTLPAGWRALVP